LVVVALVARLILDQMASQAEYQLLIMVDQIQYNLLAVAVVALLMLLALLVVLVVEGDKKTLLDNKH
jgi:hypothetical protein